MNIPTAQQAQLIKKAKKKLREHGCKKIQDYALQYIGPAGKAHVFSYWDRQNIGGFFIKVWEDESETSIFKRI